MPEGDKDSPRLRQNLGQVLKEIILRAQWREIPTLEAARHWQRRMMGGLDVPDRRYVGAFRGEPGLERTQVRVGAIFGVDSADVSEELTRFEKKLQALVVELDALLPMDLEFDVDQLAAVIDLCAWCMLNGSASTHLRTATAGLPDSGPMASPFVMDFRHSSDCAQGPTQAAEMLARERCKATGNRLRSYFATCSAIF